MINSIKFDRNIIQTFLQSLNRKIKKKKIINNNQHKTQKKKKKD